ncbi:MAG: hypothetical protein M0C28_23110 [Candidatus Moduliflexus flocculans]|nr:hypothetical protein [Candidatus Moduliflexus flocculans]
MARIPRQPAAQTARGSRASRCSAASVRCRRIRPARHGEPLARHLPVPRLRAYAVFAARIRGRGWFRPPLGETPARPASGHRAQELAGRAGASAAKGPAVRVRSAGQSWTGPAG